MFLLQAPSAQRVERFLADMHQADFSYPEVGATRTAVPHGYTVDHSRIRLGAGAQAFARAADAVRGWRMFCLPWVHIFPQQPPIREGSTVVIVGRHFGFSSLNACRIVYVLDEPHSFGFGYGTLSVHAERGEERFTVKWRADDSVWYDILAFSRPNVWLARLGYPFSRALQRRFARDSKAAMVDALRQTAG